MYQSIINLCTKVLWFSKMFNIMNGEFFNENFNVSMQMSHIHQMFQQEKNKYTIFKSKFNVLSIYFVFKYKISNLWKPTQKFLRSRCNSRFYYLDKEPREIQKDSIKCLIIFLILHLLYLPNDYNEIKKSYSDSKKTLSQ